jgi:hypothetical protein
MFSHHQAGMSGPSFQKASHIVSISITCNPPHIVEGRLEVKLPTIWTDEKQSREEAERRERLEERRVRRKKMQMRER